MSFEEVVAKCLQLCKELEHSGFDDIEVLEYTETQAVQAKRWWASTTIEHDEPMTQRERELIALLPMIQNFLQ